MEFMTDPGGGGYRREQVDSYVGELRRMYREIFEAHRELQRQYDETQMRSQELQAEFEREMGAYRAQREAIAQALIQAQYLSIQMLNAARAEAEQMRFGLIPQQIPNYYG